MTILRVVRVPFHLPLSAESSRHCVLSSGIKRRVPPRYQSKEKKMWNISIRSTTNALPEKRAVWTDSINYYTFSELESIFNDQIYTLNISKKTVLLLSPIPGWLESPDFCWLAALNAAQTKKISPERGNQNNLLEDPTYNHCVYTYMLFHCTTIASKRLLIIEFVYLAPKY